MQATPPSKGFAASTMSPALFLASEEAISSVKRKAHFRRFSTEMAKRLRLDPSTVKEDLTITMYHERTQTLLPVDREQFHVLIPFEDKIEQIKNRYRCFIVYCDK